jgi:hypothetical protein
MVRVSHRAASGRGTFPGFGVPGHRAVGSTVW